MTLDPMEDRPVVEVLSRVLKEVLDRYWRLVLEEFDGDVAQRGGDDDDRVAWRRFERRRGRHGLAGGSLERSHEEQHQEHACIVANPAVTTQDGKSASVATLAGSAPDD